MPVPVTEKVSIEDAEIYCECRGIDPTLLLIHDAMEDTGFYSSAAEILSGEFTVVIFDRRCNSRSSGDRNTDMSIAQQARDTATIFILS